MRTLVLIAALALAGCGTVKLQFEAETGSTVAIGENTCVAPCTLEVDAGQAVGIRVIPPAPAPAPMVAQKPRPRPKTMRRPPVSADPNIWPKPAPFPAQAPQ
jgi:hypothetical protein